MSAAGVAEWTAEASPRFKARMAGLLYLIVGVAGGFAEVFVRGKLVVSGDAAATAANILAHESLYRFGGVADLIGLAGDTALAVIFYELFRPVSRSLSLLAAFFRLMFVAVMAANTVNHFAVLIFLRGSHDASTFTAAQLQTQAQVALQAACVGLQHRPRLLRSRLPAAGCPHLSIDLYASSSGHPRGDRGRRLPHQQFRALPRPFIRRFRIPVRSGAVRHGRACADPLARGDGRQQSTMEGAGRGSGRTQDPLAIIHEQRQTVPRSVIPSRRSCKAAEDGRGIPSRSTKPLRWQRIPRRLRGSE
jgi:hypothetical protein